MSELAGTEFGDPERIWAESLVDVVTPDDEPALQPPDLTEPEEFYRRVDLRRSWFAVPGLILVFTAVLIAIPFFPGVTDLAARQVPAWVLPTVCWVLAGVGIIAAAYVLLRDPRMSQQPAAQEAYEQFRRSGVLGRVARTSLVLRFSAEGPSTKAGLVLDVNCDVEQTRRLERAFEAWLDVVGSDRHLRARIAGWVLALNEPIASERIFGADAVGAYLLPYESVSLWAVILPAAGEPIADGSSPRLRSLSVY